MKHCLRTGWTVKEGLQIQISDSESQTKVRIKSKEFEELHPHQAQSLVHPTISILALSLLLLCASCHNLQETYQLSWRTRTLK